MPKAIELQQHASVIVHRVDTLTALALVPYISFLSRHNLERVDVLELGLLSLLEARMLLSATGYLPLRDWEVSTPALVSFLVVVLALNAAARFVPALRKKAHEE